MPHAMAGGAAEPDTPIKGTDADDKRVAMLQLELEAAKTASIAAKARYRMLLNEYPGVDLGALADAAEESALAANRVAGFARLLSRASS